MKNFTNRIPNFRLTLLLISLLLAETFPLSASFIRQDRVWLCSTQELGEYTAKYMKFMDSRDFMDKTYTRVSTIKKVTWDFGMTNIRIEDDIDETEAWMREENGKVYLLLDGWGPDSEMYSGSSTDPYEGLLYDFNAVNDSSYEGISQYRHFGNDPGRYCEGSYLVTSVGTETVGDEEVKCWNVKFCPKGQEELSPQVFSIVEGIGIIDYGGLFYLETFYMTSGGSIFYNSFDCCMDLDGNILYPKDYNKELPGGGLTSSVTEIGQEAVAEAAPIYDILGRRITEPVPGQLYIQGGKKHIVR
ncbi:MAG: hypothetical protein K2K98_01770 [Muribaculaceae bacterium]|nr:hypothetical protein [Muribaculaceae bacterium]